MIIDIEHQPRLRRLNATARWMAETTRGTRTWTAFGDSAWEAVSRVMRLYAYDKLRAAEGACDLPTTPEEWRKEHLRICEKQQTGIGTFVLNGRRVRVCPGFEESGWSTVGHAVTHIEVYCNACGATWKGTQS